MYDTIILGGRSAERKRYKVMSVQEGQISFSNMDVQSEATGGNSDREWRRLRFESGKSYRIKFIDTSLEMRHRHYNPSEGNNKKGYYRCLAHAGYCPVCAAAANGFGGEGKYKLKKAQETFGANVLVYNTDAQGNPTQPLNAEVYFWAFNAKKFVEIRGIQQEWGDITKLDLKLTCADDQAAQFQNVSITNCAQCIYLSDPAFKAVCDAKIEKDKYPLAKMLCKEVNAQEMVAAFGLPSTYLPQDVQAQMPGGQQTVTAYANQAPQAPIPQAPVQQSVPVQQPAPVQQAAPVQQPVYPQGGLNYQAAPAQPVQAAPVQPSPVAQSTVQPVVQETVAPVPQVVPVPQVAPVSQVAPVQTAPAQAPADAYADLDALQNILG